VDEARDGLGGNAAVYWCCQTAFWIASSLLFRVRAWGVEHVPRRGGALVVCNHESFVDPLLVGAPLSRQMYYMARRTLFEVPGLGWLFRALKAFPVEREGVDRRAMRTAVALMRCGEALAVFPEGTRTSDGEVQRFRAGFTLLASQARVPIVPAAVYGAYAAWPRHRRLPRPGRVHVAYGERMAAPGAGGSERRAAAEEVRRRVMALREGLRAKD